MVIDSHTHMVSERFLRLAEADPDRYGADVKETGDGFVLRTRFPSMFQSTDMMIPKHTYDWESRLRKMDERGTQMQVLSGVTTLAHYWARPEISHEVARAFNDDISEACNRFPDRFLGLAALPMADVGLALEELERVVDSLGLAGVQLLSHVEGKNLDDESLRPVFARTADLGLPLFIHPTTGLAPERMSKHFLFNSIGFPTEQAIALASLIGGGVLDENPMLTIAMCHAAGSFLFLQGRISAGFAAGGGTRAIKPSLSDYVEQIYVDVLALDDHALRYVIESMGSERVLFGTDWPWPMEDREALDRVSRVPGLAAEELERILSGNAERLFAKSLQAP